MITKNFKLWQKALLCRKTSAAETINLAQPIVDLNGVKKETIHFGTGILSYVTFYSNDEVSTTHTQSGMCLLVGTNDTEATENDYTINAIETISSVAAQTINRVIDNNGKFAMQITRTLKNTAEEDITIKELGLFHMVTYSKTSGDYNNCLFAREVLPTPLVVPSGANFTVSMVVRV